MEAWKRGLLAITMYCWKAEVYTNRVQRPRADAIFRKWWTSDMNKKRQAFHRWSNTIQQWRCLRFQQQFDHLKRKAAKLREEIDSYSSKAGSHREELSALHQTVATLEARNSKLTLRREIAHSFLTIDSLDMLTAEAASWVYAGRSLCRIFLEHLSSVSGLNAKRKPAGGKRNAFYFIEGAETDSNLNLPKPPYRLTDLCPGGVDSSILACRQSDTANTSIFSLSKYYNHFLNKGKQIGAGNSYDPGTVAAPPGWPGTLMHSVVDHQLRRSIREAIRSDIRDRAKLYRGYSASDSENLADFQPMDRSRLVSQVSEALTYTEPESEEGTEEIARGTLALILGAGEYGKFGKFFHADGSLTSGARSRRALSLEDLKREFQKKFYRETMDNMFYWAYVWNAPLVHGLIQSFSDNENNEVNIPKFSDNLVYSIKLRGSNENCFSKAFSVLLSGLCRAYGGMSMENGCLHKLAHMSARSICDVLHSLPADDSEKDDNNVLESYYSLVLIGESDKRCMLGIPIPLWRETESTDIQALRQQYILSRHNLSKAIFGSISNIQNTVGKELNKAVGDDDKNSPRKSLSKADVLSSPISFPSVWKTHEEHILRNSIKAQLPFVNWPTISLEQSLEWCANQIGSVSRGTVEKNTREQKEEFERRLLRLSKPYIHSSAYFAFRAYGHRFFPRNARTGVAERAVLQQLQLAASVAFCLEPEEDSVDRFFISQLPRNSETLRSRGIHYSHYLSKCSRAVRKNCFLGYDDSRELNAALSLALGSYGANWMIATLLSHWYSSEAKVANDDATIVGPIPQQCLRAQAMKVSTDQNSTNLKVGIGQWFVKQLYLCLEGAEHAAADARASATAYHKHLDYVASDLWEDNLKELDKQEDHFQKSAPVDKGSPEPSSYVQAATDEEEMFTPDAEKVNDVLAVWGLCTYCQENSDRLELGYEGHGDEYMLSALHASGVLESNEIREELRDEYKRIVSTLESFGTTLLSVFRAYAETSASELKMDSYSFLQLLKDAKILTFSPGAFGKDSGKLSPDDVMCPQHSDERGSSTLHKPSLRAAIGVERNRLFLNPAEFGEALLRVSAGMTLNMNAGDVKNVYDQIYQIDDRIVGRKQMLRRKLYLPRNEIEIAGLADSLRAMLEQNVQEHISASNPHPLQQMLKTAKFEVVFSRFGSRLHEVFKRYCLWQQQALEKAKQQALKEKRRKNRNRRPNVNIASSNYDGFDQTAENERQGSPGGFDEVEFTTGEVASATDEEIDTSKLVTLIENRKNYGGEWAVETWLKFCSDAYILNDNVSVLDAKDIFYSVGQKADEDDEESSEDSGDDSDDESSSWGHVQQAIEDEEEEEKTMSFVEFKEAIATVAAYLYRDPHAPLVSKLERFLETYASLISESAQCITRRRSVSQPQSDDPSESDFLLLLD
eukprot:gb/GECG01006115.1/.p1 GENE.gb/GECG01006115.1/~~gb/GECG01006115.1/.p1  ORF type:complete len:1415 (+),score=198.98 gb/GECG01006115.1/:1-4245(+)